MDKVIFSGSKYEPYKDFWRQFQNSHQRGFAFRQYQAQSKSGQELKSSSFVLDADKTAPILEMVNSNDMGVFVSLLSVTSALLKIYTGEPKVTIDTPLLQSKNASVRYTSVVPLNFDLEGSKSWQAHLTEVQKLAKESYTYQNFPLQFIEDENNENSSIYTTNVLISYEGLHDSLEDFGKYDLVLQAKRDEDRVHFTISYKEGLYDDASILLIKGHLETLLDKLRSLTATLDESNCLTAEEKEKILTEFNGPKTPYTTNKGLVGLFESMVQEKPEAIAVQANEVEVTYAQLSEKSNQLARHLHDQMGVKQGDAVGLMVERSERMIVGLMAILKLGAVYVPIDAVHMSEHTESIFKDADIQALLLDSTYMFNISGYNKPAFVLDYQLDQLEESKDHFDLGYENNSLAYIIFTSGSTGKRKGVMVNYSSLHNLCSWYTETYKMGTSSNVLLMVPFGFDASIKNMIAPLTAGGKVVVSPGGNFDPEALAALIQSQKVTHINCVPTAFLPILQYAGRTDYNKLSSLKWLAFGGEQLNVKPFNEWIAGGSEVKITNVYGPTEGVDSSTIYEVPSDPKEQPAHIPIGKPVPNVELFILNESLQPVPVGYKGEIFLGGLGVAQGYLASPELTKEKFIDNPFSSVQGEKVYRTGDIARWTTEGDIEFLGRIDNQLKVGGIRIEPGEIEHTLQQHPAIEEAYLSVTNGEEGKSLTATLKLDKSLTSPIFQIINHLNSDADLLSSLYKFPNGMMAFHVNKTETDFIYNEVFADQCYLRHGIKIQPGDVIFDVGANIGMFSMFSALHFEGVKVFAFEPIPDVYKVLKANSALYSENIKAYNVGVSNEENTATFTYYPNNTALSGRYGDEADDKRILRTTLINQLQENGDSVEETRINDVIDARIKGEEVTCQLRRISDIIRENNVDRIDYLKVDVERSELNVLEGIEEEHWPLIKQIVIEVHDEDGRLETIQSLLEKHGFAVFTKEEDLLKDTGLYNLYATKDTESLNQGEHFQVPVVFNQQGMWTSKKELLQNIRTFCAEHMPQYMIPSTLEIAETIPLTSNGKVDRSKLKDFGQLDYEPEHNIIAPRNETEEILVSIWEKMMGRKPIGIQDDFFELGGHSLTALRITHHIYEELGANVSLNSIFMYRTIEELAPEIEHSKEKTIELVRAPEGQPYYEVSHAQKRLWVIHQFKESEAAYHMPAAYSLRDINKHALASAFGTLIERHESLRTTFDTIDGEPKQVIHPSDDFNFQLEEVDLRSSNDVESQLATITQQVVNTPFDLEKGPLLRAKLVQAGENEYRFLFVMHHIISDGWSILVMSRELFALYFAYSQGNPNPLAPLNIQYKDYAFTQNLSLSNEALSGDKAYWMKQFEGDIPVLNLPTDRTRPAVKTFNGSFVSTTLSTDVSGKLQMIGQQHGTSLFVTLLALVNTLLHRYTGQKDIIIGTTVAGREHSGLEGQIGFYINMIAIRTKLSGDDNFDQLLTKVGGTVFDGLNHQQYPFDRLVDDLELKRDPSRSPLFDVIVEFLNFKTEGNEGATDQPEEDNNGIKPESAPYPISKYDLSFKFDQSEKGIMAAMEYNTDLFTHERATAILKHFEKLAESVVEQVDLPINQLEYITAEEKEKLLTSSGAVQVNKEELVSVVELFERQVRETPDHTCVRIGGSTLTYETLNKKANQLAHHLKNEYKVEANDVVGLMLPNSENMIIAILAILKSGAGFLPIEGSYPDQRKSLLLNDTAAKVLITTADAILDIGSVFNGNLFAIDVQLSELETVEENLSLASSMSDLAYIMFTSGSTGKPKGVAINHQNLANYIIWANQYYSEGKYNDMPMALFTSLSFDLTLTSVFSSLTRGEKLIIFENNEIDKKLAEVFSASSPVRFIKLTPSHIDLLGELSIEKTWVEKVIIGGEELQQRHIDILRGLNPTVEVYNEYGPTETTIGSTVKRIEIEKSPITVGSPISNTSVYVLDENQKLLPEGVPGEICIAGLGLSSGYWNSPDLTEEKFIEIDIENAGSVRLYRTGDLGKWVSTGELVMLGRIDQQVKIRGFRVEIGEIENILSQLEWFDNSAVIARKSEGGDYELVTYYTTTEEGDIGDGEIRMKLSSMLPDYMVPSYFVALDTLPITSNGKVDRKALANIELGAENRSQEYVAPETTDEKVLVEIWETVLMKDRVGLNDNFFSLGGHSLKAIQMVARIQKEFNVQIAIADIFTSPVLKDLLSKVTSSSRNDFEAIEAIPEQEYYDVSYAQKRLWVVSQFDGMESAYNIPASYIFDGNFDADLFSKACYALLERHEILRTTFAQVEGEVKQKVHATSQYPFEVGRVDLTEEETSKDSMDKWLQDQIKKPFDLEKGPLLSANLVKLESEKTLLLFVVHHIIYDGWSMGVLIEEVLTLYEAFLKGQENPLPPLAIQYKDYAHWQRERLSGRYLANHRKYWNDKFKDGAPLLAFDTDYPRPKLRTNQGDIMSFVLEKGHVEAINKLCQENEVSLFMFFMAVVNTLFYRYTGQEDIVIGTPVSDRDHHDLERQIGFYINNLAIRTQFDRDDTFEALLEKVKAVSLEAYDHQVYPYDLLVEDLGLAKDTGRFPLFDILLLVENKDESVEKAGPEDFATEAFNSGYIVSNMDMRIVLQESSENISGYIEYNIGLFKQATITELLTRMQQIMGAVLHNDQLKLYEIEIGNDTDEDEKIEVSTEFNF